MQDRDKISRPGARACIALAVLLVSCAGLGQYTWVDDYGGPPSASDAAYVIAAGDLLNVRVFNQEAMSARARVRKDGMISLPLLGDVAAAGQPPALLAKALEGRYKGYINNPLVTVSLEEPARLEIPVVGEVARPGVYVLDGETGVLQVLASAGGLTEFAHGDRIFVLRRSPAGSRIRFTFESLRRAAGRSGSFRLRSGDTVVVE